MLNLVVTDNDRTNKIYNSYLQTLNLDGSIKGVIEISKSDTSYTYIGEYTIKPIIIAPTTVTYVVSLQVYMGSSWHEIENVTSNVFDFSKYLFITPTRLEVSSSNPVYVSIPIMESKR